MSNVLDMSSITVRYFFDSSSYLYISIGKLSCIIHRETQGQNYRKAIKHEISSKPLIIIVD